MKNSSQLRRSWIGALLCGAAIGPLLGQDPEPAPSEPPGPARSYPDGVIALVEGHPIVAHEVELFCRLRADYREAPPLQAAEIRAEQLDVLIEQVVLLRLAEEKQLHFTPEDEQRLQAELAQVARDYGGKEGLIRALREINVPFAFFARRQRENILVSKLLVSSISRDIFVTPAEIRRYYASHGSQFRHQGETRIRQIVLYPDPEQAYRVPPAIQAQVDEATWEARSLAEALRKRALAGESFAALAREHSMGVHFDQEEVFPGAARLASVLVRPVGAQVDALEVGAVSEVVEAERGSLHLVLLVERRPAGTYPLEEVQAEIEATLKDEVWKERLEGWIDQAVAKAHVLRYTNPR